MRKEYDSTSDTLLHIKRVNQLLLEVVKDLIDRSTNHELHYLFNKSLPVIHRIIADPPYTGEDANRYGTVLCNRQAVFSEAMKVLKPGGHLVWFDQVKPMWSRHEHTLVGEIGVSISSNHRMRGLWIYEKRELPEDAA